MQASSTSFTPRGRSFLVTGGAGFIGSHIVERLVAEGGRVRVLDLFTTGRHQNLKGVMGEIELIEGDVSNLETVQQAMEGIEFVFHLAALVSVPESVKYPERCFESNIKGTHNLLLAARQVEVQRLVFSSSSAIYGDQPVPHHEGMAPKALSPYAAAKLSGEQLCRSFAHVYGLPTVCLRYFNVFGPRQDPSGGYAAAIPKFTSRLIKGEAPIIYGDGYQSRDFVYIANVVDANLQACQQENAIGGIFNIGTGVETDLLDLLKVLETVTGIAVPPIFQEPRAGDIKRSYSDITMAEKVLNYRPVIGLHQGLDRTVAWYRELGVNYWG
jgi:nucleoside-diphosphate-sugar epimerase